MPEAPLHGAAVQWEMQAEAHAASALAICLTGKEKHSLLLPASPATGCAG